METKDFLESLNNYYNLKFNYEKKIKNMKKSIINNPLLNKKQKQEKLMAVTSKCISCKRNVGTIFSMKDGILKAICGSSSNPCNLNIEIDRGKFISLPYLIKNFDEITEDDKQSIILLKLDLLFGYLSEQTVLSKFETMKNDLNEDLESLVGYRKDYLNITSNLENKESLRVLTSTINEIIVNIKDIIKQFNETSNTQLIKDVINIYINELKPNLQLIQANKYKYQAMEFNEDTNTYHLIQRPFTLSDLLVTFRKPQVISFNVDKSVEEKRRLEEEKEEMEEEEPIESEKPKLTIINDDVMIGKDKIAEKNNYEQNKKLMEDSQQITVQKANELGYKFEMLYVDEKRSELFAIDEDTKQIFYVVFPNKKVPVEEKDISDDTEVPPPPPPKTPSGTPPQIQIERAKQEEKDISDDTEVPPPPRTPSGTPPQIQIERAKQKQTIDDDDDDIYRYM